MSNVVERIPSLAEFSSAKVDGTEWFLNCVGRFGLEQTIIRSRYANYMGWLDKFFPKGGNRKLTPHEIVCLKHSWLDTGHPEQYFVGLMNLGSRDERWLLPDSI